jgi:3',5'-cyclic AMP phosphodiesterase CpdA
MTTFRITQISDTHLSPRFPAIADNFAYVSAHLAQTAPDLVINTGDAAFDGPDRPEDLAYARALHDAIGVPCRFIPGNHDIGDNPTQTTPRPRQLVSAANREAFVAAFSHDRWTLDAAGWTLIGLNAMILNSGLDAEREQDAWLAREIDKARGRPIALFMHKPLCKTAPDEPELAATDNRYIPVPARQRLNTLLARADVRLIASGHVHQRRDVMIGRTRHVWAPSTAFVIGSDTRQERIGVKELGLVEYLFSPDRVDVHHVNLPGLVTIDIDDVLQQLSTMTAVS